MAKEVRLKYVLVDNVSKGAAKIEKSLTSMEASMHSFDKKVEGMSKDKTFSKWSDSSTKSLGKLNDKMATSSKKAAALNRTLGTTGKRYESLNSALGSSNAHQKEFNRQTGKGVTAVKAQNTALKNLNDAQDAHGKSITKTTQKVNTQANSFQFLSASAKFAADNLDELHKREEKLHDTMKKKNHEAKIQRTHLSGLGRNAGQLSKRLDHTSTAVDKLTKKFHDLKKQDGAFFEGFDFGASILRTLLKVAAILPVIGVGFGHISNMTSGATVGVMGLLGSVTRLSGALAILPGLYAAIGAAAGTAASISALFIGPAMKGGKSVTDIDKRLAEAKLAAKRTSQRATFTEDKKLASAQASARQSTTTAGLAAAEARISKITKDRAKNISTSLAPAEDKIAKITEERAKILATMPPRAAEFNKKLAETKSTWREIWFGPGGKQADKIMGTLIGGLDRAKQLMKDFAPLTARATSSLETLSSTLGNITNNKIFSKNLAGIGNNSFSNFDKILGIVNNLAPVTSVIALNTTKTTGKALDMASAWSEGLTSAEKIQDVGNKTSLFFDRGLKSLKGWVTSIGHFASGFANLVLPTADSFDKRITSISKRFDKWSAKVSGDGSAKAFSENGFKTLDAMGRVMLALFGVIGKIGTNKAANKATVDALDSLSRGITNFGDFALKSMVQLAPALTDFFAAFGKMHAGSGDIILRTFVMVTEAFTYLFKGLDKIPGSDKLFGIATATLLVGTALGHVAGTAAAATSGLAKVAGSLGKLSNLGKGEKAASAGSKLGKGAKTGSFLGRLLGRFAGPLNVAADVAAADVHVTNTPTSPLYVMVMNPSGDGAIKSLLKKFGFGGAAAGGATATASKATKWSKAGTRARILGSSLAESRAGQAVSKFIKNPAAKGAGAVAGASILSDVLLLAHIKHEADKHRPTEKVAKKPQDAVSQGLKENDLNDKVGNLGYGGTLPDKIKAYHARRVHEPQTVPGVPGGFGAPTFEKNQYFGASIKALTADSKKKQQLQNQSIVTLKTGNTKYTNNVKAGSVAGQAAFAKGGRKLSVASNKAGQAAAKPLARWAGVVRQIMASLGAPSAPVAGAAAASAGSSTPATGGASGGSSTGSSLGGIASNVAGAVSGLFGGSTGDSATGSGSTTAPSGGAAAGGVSFNGHPSNVNAGLIPFIQKAQAGGLVVTSTTDHSKFTTSGNVSNHWLGLAADVSNGTAPTPEMDAMYSQLVPYARSGALSELIYKHNGWKRGTAYNYTGTDHFNHVHMALGSGMGAGAVGGVGQAGGSATNIPPVPGLGNTAFGAAVQAMADNVRSGIVAQLGRSGTGAAAGMEAGGAAGSNGSDPRGIAQTMMSQFGFGPDQFAPLDKLWTKESKWDVSADNPESSAFGIPQCTDYNTLILTRRGWLRHDEVQIGDETLGHNPETGKSEWTEITDVIHPGEQEIFEFGTYNWTGRSTANHRWLVETKKNGKPFAEEMVELQDVKRHKHTFLLSKEADTGDGLPITLEEAALLGWIMGDGWREDAKKTLRKTPDRGSLYHHRPMTFHVCQAKEIHWWHIEWALAGNGRITRTRELPSGKFSREWRLSAPYARDLVERAGADPKDDSFTIVMNMSPEQRKAWLEAVIRAEGYRASGYSEDGREVLAPKPNKNYTQVCQNEGNAAEAIKLAIYLEGNLASVKRDKRELGMRASGIRINAVNLTIGIKKAHIRADSIKIKSLGIQPVWCVTTKLGTWTAAQGDSIFLTGNSLPGSKMASEGADWRTNPTTQIRWGLKYIKERYGTPQAAWEHSQAVNWYGNGGDFIAKKPQLIGVGDKQAERVQVTPLTGPNKGSSGGGITISPTIVLQGGNFTNADGAKKMTDEISKTMIKEMMAALRNHNPDSDI